MPAPTLSLKFGQRSSPLPSYRQAHLGSWKKDSATGPKEANSRLQTLPGDPGRGVGLLGEFRISSGSLLGLYQEGP